jgi:hypothetical protein
LIALVRVGLGTALVPAFTIADETAIVGVPVAGDVPRLEIALVTSGQRSRLSLASFAVVAALAFVQPRPEAIALAPPPTRRNMLPPRRRRRLRHPAAGRW